jgi:hypothetical protein
MRSNRTRSNLAFTLPLALLLAAGCWRRTELATVWHEPDPTLLNFKRTVAVFASTDESLRRSVEDQLSQLFPHAMPAYRAIPNAGGADKETILQQLRGAGFDGAIVMRVTNVSEQVTYNGTYWGGPYGYGFGNYWGSAWASPYNPCCVTVTQIVSVETNIYSLKDDRLVFAALSQTSDPANAGKLTRSVMRHINEELRKNGMIASSPARPVDAAAEVARR